MNVRLDQNQSENGKYNLFSDWFVRFQKDFSVCIRSGNAEERITTLLYPVPWDRLRCRNDVTLEMSAILKRKVSGIEVINSSKNVELAGEHPTYTYREIGFCFSSIFLSITLVRGIFQQFRGSAGQYTKCHQLMHHRAVGNADVLHCLLCNVKNGPLFDIQSFCCSSVFVFTPVTKMHVSQITIC